MTYNQTSALLAGRIHAYQVIESQCRNEIRQLKMKLVAALEIEKSTEYKRVSEAKIKEAISHWGIQNEGDNDNE